MNSINKTNIIFYVKDQAKSRDFYSQVLNSAPILDVPGMTEFKLSDNCTLGLMPETGIKRLLGDKLPDPSKATGIPRAEIYLYVDNPVEFHERAINAGAFELSGFEPRNWGDSAAYSLDPDCHVLAFAKKIENQE